MAETSEIPELETKQFQFRVLTDMTEGAVPFYKDGQFIEKTIPEDEDEPREEEIEQLEVGMRNLLVIAKKFGKVLLALKDSIVIGDIESLVQFTKSLAQESSPPPTLPPNSKLFKISGETHISQIALSFDDLYVSVVCGKELLTFNLPSLVHSEKNEPFIAKFEQDILTLAPSPRAHDVLVLLVDGEVHTGSFSLQQFKNTKDSVSALCWHPTEDNIFFGLESGEIVEAPFGNMNKHLQEIEPPSELEEGAQCYYIFAIPGHLILAFSPLEDFLLLHIYDLSKEKFLEVNPYGHMANKFYETFFSVWIQEWSLLIFASTCNSEVHLLLLENGEWSLVSISDDSKRVSLPEKENDEGSYIRGMDLDLTNKNTVILDDKKDPDDQDLVRMPRLLLYLDSGAIAAYDLVKVDSHTQPPFLVNCSEVPLPQKANLSPPSTNLNPPSTNLNPPSTNLNPPSTNLNPPSTNLNPPSTNLNQPSTNLNPPSTSVNPINFTTAQPNPLSSQQPLKPVPPVIDPEILKEQARKEQEERMRREEERLRKEQEERLRKEEEERLRKEQEEQARKEQEERLRKEQERLRKEQEERLRKEQEERLRKEQEDQLRKEQEEKLRKEEERARSVTGQIQNLLEKFGTSMKTLRQAALDNERKITTIKQNQQGFSEAALMQLKRQTTQLANTRQQLQEQHDSHFKKSEQIKQVSINSIRQAAYAATLKEDRENPHYQLLVRSRKLDPESAEKQRQIRTHYDGVITQIRDLKQFLDQIHLQQKKQQKLSHHHHLGSHARAPTIDTVFRTTDTLTKEIRRENERLDHIQDELAVLLKKTARRVSTNRSLSASNDSAVNLSRVHQGKKNALRELLYSRPLEPPKPSSTNNASLISGNSSLTKKPSSQQVSFSQDSPVMLTAKPNHAVSDTPASPLPMLGLKSSSPLDSPLPRPSPSPASGAMKLPVDSAKGTQPSVIPVIDPKQNASVSESKGLGAFSYLSKPAATAESKPTASAPPSGTFSFMKDTSSTKPTDSKPAPAPFALGPIPSTKPTESKPTSLGSFSFLKDTSTSNAKPTDSGTSAIKPPESTKPADSGKPNDPAKPPESTKPTDSKPASSPFAFGPLPSGSGTGSSSSSGFAFGSLPSGKPSDSKPSIVSAASSSTESKPTSLGSFSFLKDTSTSSTKPADSDSGTSAIKPPESTKPADSGKPAKPTDSETSGTTKPTDSEKASDPAKSTESTKTTNSKPASSPFAFGPLPSGSGTGSSSSSGFAFGSLPKPTDSKPTSTTSSSSSFSFSKDTSTSSTKPTDSEKASDPAKPPESTKPTDSKPASSPFAFGPLPSGSGTGSSSSSGFAFGSSSKPSDSKPTSTTAGTSPFATTGSNLKPTAGFPFGSGAKSTSTSTGASPFPNFGSNTKPSSTPSGTLPPFSMSGLGANPASAANSTKPAPFSTPTPFAMATGSGASPSASGSPLTNNTFSFTSKPNPASSTSPAFSPFPTPSASGGAASGGIAFGSTTQLGTNLFHNQPTQFSMQLKPATPAGPAPAQGGSAFAAFAKPQQQSSSFGALSGQQSIFGGQAQSQQPAYHPPTSASSSDWAPRK